MARRVFVLAVGILALAASAMAGTILDVAFTPPAGANCSSTLTPSAYSETLTLGACTGDGPITFNQQPYVTATATPLQVSVDGLAALENGAFNSGMAIGASAQYEGSLEAFGGTGSAFLKFQVEAFGADLFNGDFAMEGEGVNFPISSFMQQEQFTVPVTFGDPVDYSLAVSHSFYTWNEADVMMAGIAIVNLEVVDANGVPIAGAEVSTVSGANFSTSAVPEPGSAALIAIGAGLLVLGRCLKKWSRERGSNS